MHFILVTSPSCERSAFETTNGEGIYSEGSPSTFVYFNVMRFDLRRLSQEQAEVIRMPSECDAS